MCLFIPGWTSRMQAIALAMASFWSLARLVHVPGGGRLYHHLVLSIRTCSGVNAAFPPKMIYFCHTVAALHHHSKLSDTVEGYCSG
jgi:hypothetical protein